MHMFTGLITMIKKCHYFLNTYFIFYVVPLTKSENLRIPLPLNRKFHPFYQSTNFIRREKERYLTLSNDTNPLKAKKQQRQQKV